MSAIASFYVLQKAKFDEYCKMAHLVPSSLAPKEPEPDKIILEVVTQKEMQSAEYRKKQQYYKSLFDYLHRNAKEPFEYHWSGYVMADLLLTLKEAKKIDLMEFALRDAREKHGSESWVFTKELKDKYLLQLDPSKYREGELKYWYACTQERHRDEVLKQVASKLGKEQLKQFADTVANHTDDFPERGKAFLDGIRVIHQCLELVNDETVVLLTIG